MSYKVYLDEQGRPPLSVDEVMLALWESKGDYSAAAQALERPRFSVKALIEPPLKPCCCSWKSLRGTCVHGSGENVIFAAVEKGDMGAARLVVQTLGKDDGWSRPCCRHAGKERSSPIIDQGPRCALL